MNSKLPLLPLNRTAGADDPVAELGGLTTRQALHRIAYAEAEALVDHDASQVARAVVAVVAVSGTSGFAADNLDAYGWLLDRCGCGSSTAHDSSRLSRGPTGGSGLAPVAYPRRTTVRIISVRMTVPSSTSPVPSA